MRLLPAKRGGIFPNVGVKGLILAFINSVLALTLLYILLQSFTILYIILQSFTIFYNLLQSFTEIYRALHCFTLLYILLQKSMHTFCYELWWAPCVAYLNSRYCYEDEDTSCDKASCDEVAEDDCSAYDS